MVNPQNGATKKNEISVYADTKSSPQPPGYFNERKRVQYRIKCTVYNPCLLGWKPKTVNGIYHWKKGLLEGDKRFFTSPFFFLSFHIA